MKKYIVLLAVLFAAKASAMEQPIERSKKVSPALQVAALPLTSYIQIIDDIIDAKASKEKDKEGKEITRDKRAELAMLDIRKFFLTLEPSEISRLFKSKIVAGAIIKKLADAFYEGNVVLAALSLRTEGAADWVREHMETNAQLHSGFTNVLCGRPTTTLPKLRFLVERVGLNPVMPCGDYGSTTFLGNLDSLENVKYLLAEQLKKIPESEREEAKKRLLDVRDHGGWSLLHYAVVFHYADSLRWLLNELKMPDVKNNNDMTPLMMASEKGFIEPVKILLDGGANVNEKTESGSTALVDAAVHGYLPIVKLLVEKGAKTNIVLDGKSLTDIIIGMTYGRDEYKAIADYLSEHEIEEKKLAEGKETGWLGAVTSWWSRK